MSASTISTGFSQEAFDAFVAARDEPTWLNAMRREAWRRFQEMPMPSVRDEEWMRTDIRLFKLDRFAFPGLTSDGNGIIERGAPHALLAAGVDLAGRAVTIDSRQVSDK